MERAPLRYKEYHPYGSTAWWLFDSSRGVSQTRYKYTGMERDEETSLQAHGARYFAVWLARWISADASGLKDGPNLYAYAHARPIVSLDTLGRWSLTGIYNETVATASGIYNDPAGSARAAASSIKQAISSANPVISSAVPALAAGAVAATGLEVRKLIEDANPSPAPAKHALSEGLLSTADALDKFARDNIRRTNLPESKVDQAEAIGAGVVIAPQAYEVAEGAASALRGAPTVARTEAELLGPNPFEGASGVGRRDVPLFGTSTVEHAAPGQYSDVALPRTPGLPRVTTVPELLRTGGVPGRQGVIIQGEETSFQQLWELSEMHGVEFSLSVQQTEMGEQLVLRSGSEGTVPNPVRGTSIAHTHPSGADTPSTPDIDVLDTQQMNRLRLDPSAVAPASYIIHGGGSSGYTPFWSTLR